LVKNNKIFMSSFEKIEFLTNKTKRIQLKN